MPRILATLLLIASFIVTSAPASARTWAEIADAVRPSLVRITHPIDRPGQEATCTGFFISETRGHILTAFHCLNEGTVEALTANGHEVELVFVDEQLDIAVLISSLRGPALEPRHGTVQQGEPLAVMGFAYGYLAPALRAGHVALPTTPLHPHVPGTWLLADIPYVTGISGGPILDDRGRVLGMAQQTDVMSGVGRRIADIYRATGAYWVD